MSFFIFLFLSFSTISQAEIVQAIPLAQPQAIDNFHQVDVNLFRGARPSSQGLLWLSQNKIKTIINLEDSGSAVELERYLAKQNKINFLNFAMSGIFTPVDEGIRQALAAIANPALRPTFVHCRFGRDRTGLLIALYRVQFESWTPANAYQEWLKDGMSYSSRFELLPYYEKLTGFNP